MRPLEAVPSVANGVRRAARQVVGNWLPLRADLALKKIDELKDGTTAWEATKIGIFYGYC